MKYFVSTPRDWLLYGSQNPSLMHYSIECAKLEVRSSKHGGNFTCWKGVQSTSTGLCCNNYKDLVHGNDDAPRHDCKVWVTRSMYNSQKTTGKRKENDIQMVVRTARFDHSESTKNTCNNRSLLPITHLVLYCMYQTYNHLEK